MKQENDLFTQFLESLSRRKKKVAFDVVKRYLKIKYKVGFTDKALENRLLEFKNSVKSKSDTSNNK